jgi:GT2 family glycosyltransferase
MTNTAIIIANWNGLKYLENCFKSLAGQTYQNFEIVFVDNGSNDGSVEFIKLNYPETKIIRLEKNTGFANGCNIGIQKALEEENIKYIMILNNDTKLDERCVEALVGCAKVHPKASSIQPKVLNFFERERIDCAGILLSIDGVATNRGFGEKDGEGYDREEEIFGANGTASLFTRSALEGAQMSPGEYFDNSFFAYYEDVDLAWRLRLAGYEAFFCPKARLFHVHSATAGKISGFKAFYLNRNRFFALIKNYPLCRLLFVLFVFTPIRYIFLLFRVIMKKGRKNEEFAGQKKSAVAKEILRAWGSVLTNLPDLFKKRLVVQKSKKVRRKEICRWFRSFGVKFLDTF